MTDKTFDPTKPVQTRDGRKARILATDLSGSYSIAAVITEDNGEIFLERFASDGRELFAEETPLDLVNVPERTERFFAISEHGRALGTPSSDLSVVSRGKHGWSPTALKLTLEDGNPVSAELVR